MSFAEDNQKCRCILQKTRNGSYYKCPKHLDPVDRMLRERFKSGMRDGVDVTIKFTIGFEIYGAYEDWGQGYVVEHIDPETGDKIWASAQYLDDAVNEFIKRPYRSKPKDPNECSRPKYGWCTTHNAEIFSGAKVCTGKQ